LPEGGTRPPSTHETTAPRDLRSTKAETVKGGVYYDPVFLGGVRVASGDVNGDASPTLKLAK
jgi:hypothetical protein